MSSIIGILLASFLSTTLVAQAAILPEISSPPESNQVLIEWSATAKFTKDNPYMSKLGLSRLKQTQTPLRRSRGKGFIERVLVPDSANLDETLKEIGKIPGVVSVEPNQVYRVADVSNDNYYTNGSLWGMYSDDTTPAGPSGTTNQYGSQAEQAWAQGHTGSTTVVVGVIDTGVDYTHPDLYLNIYLNQGEIRPLSFFNSLQDVDGDGLITFRDLNSPSNSSFVTDFNNNGRIDAGDLLNDSRWENGVDNDGNGYVDDLVGWDSINGDNDPMDDNYHGTHVAGTIGGMGGNSVGVVGVNWKVLIMPLKFLSSGGWGYTDDAVELIDYFASATQAQDNSYNSNSPLMFFGTNNSWGGGGASSLLETSIRNSALKNNHFLAAAGNSSSNNNSSPFYPSNYTTLSVSGWEAVTSVASIDSNGAISSFSNYGSTTVDIGAPGSSIISTTPGNDYDYLSGTSMATPHVAGAMALFLSTYPQADRRELREVVLSTVRPTTSLNGKVVSNGRLDVMAGLDELESRYSGPPSTYTVSGPSEVNEGSSLPLTINTTNVPNGTVLYWSVTGVQSSDLTPPTLLGTATINNNSASVSLSLTADNQLEGAENLTFNLYNNPSRTTLRASKLVVVNDTSNGINFVWGTAGRDTLIGTNNRDVMAGVPSSGTSPTSLGRGQVDTVTGRGGADFFRLGQVRNGTPYVFYDNGLIGSVGSADYLLVTDFNRLVDKLLLVQGRYFSRNASSNTVIYWDRNNNGSLQLTGSNRDETIAIIRGVNLGNLTITSTSSVPWVTFNQF